MKSSEIKHKKFTIKTKVYVVSRRNKVMKHFMLYLLYPTTFFVMSPSGQCNMFQKKVIFYLSIVKLLTKVTMPIFAFCSILLSFLCELKIKIISSLLRSP